MGHTHRFLISASAMVLALSGCSSASFTAHQSSTPTATASQTVAAQTGEEIAHDLLVIAQASQAKMNAIGITESYYVNSQDADKPFTGKGDLQGDSVYDPSIKNSVTRYPLNPTFRQIGAGEGPGTQVVAEAMAIATHYKASDPMPTEIDGVFTFPQPLEDSQVEIVTVKNGLIFSVLVEDSIDDPSFTNLYEVDAYGIDNALANKILHTKS